MTLLCFQASIQSCHKCWPKTGPNHMARPLYLKGLWLQHTSCTLVCITSLGPVLNCFANHTHMCDCLSHLCMCSCTSATHAFETFQTVSCKIKFAHAMGCACSMHACGTLLFGKIIKNCCFLVLLLFVNWFIHIFLMLPKHQIL